MNQPIAVIGLGALFPGSDGPDGFWRTIVGGRDCLTDVPGSHWRLSDYHDADPSRPGKTYARRGGFVNPVPFEPLEHGIPPSTVAATDTAQLLALIVANQVLQSSKTRFEHIERDRIGVILGVASATELVSTMSGSLQRPVITQALREEGYAESEIEAICSRIDHSYVDWTESTFPGLLGNVVAGRIANRFDFGGANCVVDAACASSLAAVRMSMQELWTGAADMVISGGVDAINDIFMYMCFSKTLAMSPSGDCRPFSSDADGTMLGEGIGMFALRRLADAERDGDPIYAVLRGMGASSDGRAKSIYAPRPAGQVKALRRAYEAAGYSPATVEMVEAHGTGTVAGDAAEVEALKTVFGDGERQCALGSIKSQIGHTKAAAGAASLYKAIMAVHHKVLPATIKVREPNPSLGLDDGPFYVNTEMRPWVNGNSHPRRAGVSSFGFGGSNFHLTLEEYTGPGKHPKRIRTVASELFLISGATEPDVIFRAKQVAESAAKQDAFARVARESQRAFCASDPFRLAVVAADAVDLASKVDRVNSGKSVASPEISFGKEPAVNGGIAFLFPGQGSQYVGMGAGLGMAFDDAIRVWDEAARSLGSLAARVFPPPVFSDGERTRQMEELTATEVAQPALAVIERIYLNLLSAAGIKPDCCAGHSFGEVVALLAAGALNESQLLSVSAERGRLMAIAASQHPGAMLAVVASVAEVEPLMPEGVSIANINSPRQVVLAGPKPLIEDAAARIAARGFMVQMLPVATAFHSSIVDSAARPFTSFLQDVKFERAAVPVYANTTAREYPADTGAMRALLGSQLAKPVRFAEQIQAMYDAGARIFIEVGPGSVLTSITRACLEGKAHVTVPLDLKGKDAVTGLWSGLGKLAAAGVAIDLDFAWRDYDMPAERPVPSRHAILISGTNAGKKFPRPESPALVRPKTPVPVPHSDDSRFEAIRRIQDEMASSHAAAQRALSDAHMAYLRVTEAALAQVDGRGVQLQAVQLPQAPTVVQPVLQPVAPSPSPIAFSDLTELVMSVVAEKTGYPREILDSSMDLEADLGIDSIKRVQILAAVCEARPDLPQVDAKKMATLRTLGAILDFLQSQEALPPPPSPPVPSPPATQSVTDLVLAIVAEKTGYPRDILNPNMDLEADLGIDSIKRVQILAAVREQRPDLPDVDAKQMGGLRTLGAIVAHLGEKIPAIVPAALPEWALKNGLQRVALREVAVEYGGGIHESPGWSRITVAGNIDAIHQSVAASLSGRGVQISSNGSESDGTVFISGLPQNAEDVLQEAHRAFQAARSSRGKRFFVTVTPAASPLRRALSALVKTFALEHPGVVAKSIVHEEGADIAERITDEILHRPRESEVSLQPDGERTRLKEVILPVGTNLNTSLLDGRPVIVVTGGGRGVTASCIRGLAEVAPLRLALLGRSPLEEIPAEFAEAKTDAALKAAIVAALRARGESFAPREVESRARRVQANREIRETLDRLRQLGSEALYLSCDVMNAATVRAALESIRTRWASIDGLIHGAGVVEDKRIADKSSEQFQRVFATKVSGLRNLLDATRDDNLRFIFLFSSVAGRSGNAGQVDYAMANAAITQIALEESLRRKKTLVRALGWGPWEGGMVTPDLRAHFAQRGIPLIPMERGVAAFVQELCHHSEDPADVDVVLSARSDTVPGSFH